VIEIAVALAVVALVVDQVAIALVDIRHDRNRLDRRFRRLA
jgi:hypothetical protein